MAQRNRYVKVGLSARVPTNLIGATVESQHDDYLLLERPPAKARATKTARKPRTAKATTPISGSSATSFPGAEVANG